MATDASQELEAMAEQLVNARSSRDTLSWNGFLATEAAGTTIVDCYASMGAPWLKTAIEAQQCGEAAVEAIVAESIEGPELQNLPHVNYLAVLEISGTPKELRQLLFAVVQHSPRRAETAKEIFRMLKTKTPDSDGKITLKVAIPGEGTQGRASHYLDAYEVNDAFDGLQWYQQLHAMAFYMKGSDSAWHWHFNLTRDAVDATQSTRKFINAGLNLRVSSKFYVLRGSAEQDKLTQWKYEAVLGHYLRGCCGIFCSTGQAGYKLTHPLKYHVNAVPGDVQREDPYKWDDEDDEADDEAAEFEVKF